MTDDELTQLIYRRDARIADLERQLESARRIAVTLEQELAALPGQIADAIYDRVEDLLPDEILEGRGLTSACFIARNFKADAE